MFTNFASENRITRAFIVVSAMCAHACAIVFLATLSSTVLLLPSVQQI